MFIRAKTVLPTALLFFAVALAGNIAAQKAGPTTAKGKNLGAGEVEVKHLLLLMDADKNGKVSKQEFMNFMEAEFDRLDVNHDGELDVKELSKTHMHWVGK